MKHPIYRGGQYTNTERWAWRPSQLVQVSPGICSNASRWKRSLAFDSEQKNELKKESKMIHWRPWGSDPPTDPFWTKRVGWEVGLNLQKLILLNNYDINYCCNFIFSPPLSSSFVGLAKTHGTGREGFYFSKLFFFLNLFLKNNRPRKNKFILFS